MFYSPLSPSSYDLEFVSPTSVSYKGVIDMFIFSLQPNFLQRQAACVD